MVSKAVTLRQLDRKLRAFKRFDPGPPRRGWLRTIREALGMAQAHLGEKLGITQPSVDGLERSEVAGTITLASLRRVADALDCDVMYAVVPRRGLQVTIRARALALANTIVQRTSHSMRMEAQGVGMRESRRQVAELARELASKQPRWFWKARS